MNDLIDINTKKISAIDESISNLMKKYIFESIPVKLNDAYKNYMQHLEFYNSYISSGADEQTRLQSMRNVAIFASNLAMSLRQLHASDLSLIKITDEISMISTEIMRSIEDREVIFNPTSLTEAKKYPTENLNALDEHIKRIRDDYNELNKAYTDEIGKSFNKAFYLGTKVEELEQSVADELEKTKLLYETATEELDSKNDQLNDLLGHASKGVIAGDFEGNAADEKKTANILRTISLGIMVLIIFIVGYTLYETSQELTWQIALTRLAFTLVLSVPAAYLARESAKHRAQQYSYLQTALDLKAITPYLASLPLEEQHKVKIKMADRIFASKDFSEVAKDPYPINTQEIIIELIKKLDLKALSDSDKPKKDKDTDS